MEAKNEIKNWLNGISKIFDDAFFRYEYNKNQNIHIIEVNPLELFENKEYLNKEANFAEEFEKKHYPQELLFVSQNSLTRVKNPEFTTEDNGYYINVQDVKEINLVQEAADFNTDNDINDFSVAA